MSAPAPRAETRGGRLDLPTAATVARDAITPATQWVFAGFADRLIIPRVAYGMTRARIRGIREIGLADDEPCSQDHCGRGAQSQ